MFDIGFWEIIFICVVTLLVVGPERLPRLAKTAGLWLGRIRGFVSSVKADIDRELATEELNKALQKQAASKELEELIDEVTGDPIKAGERFPQQQQEPVPGETGNTERLKDGTVDAKEQ